MLQGGKTSSLEPPRGQGCSVLCSLDRVTMSSPHTLKRITQGLSPGRQDRGGASWRVPQKAGILPSISLALPRPWLQAERKRENSVH